MTLALPPFEITKEDNPTDPMRLFMANLANLDPIKGDGSPEGVVEAMLYTPYLNRTGSTGSLLWFKMLPEIAGDVKMGWVAV